MALPLDQADIESSAPKAPPCARCGRPSECAVWGHRVCYRCVVDWEAAADATLPATSPPADHQAFTDRWIASARRGAA